MKTIRIKVPNWIPTSRRDIQRYTQKFIKWVYPPRCVDCNKKVNNDVFSLRQLREGTHPLGMKNLESEFAIRATRSSCVSCMKKYLHALRTEMGNCTICEKRNVPVLGHHYIKSSKIFITFLWYWWNGSTFCMNCVDELLDNGHEYAS